jgi:hypothetical protein
MKKEESIRDNQLCSMGEKHERTEPQKVASLARYRDFTAIRSAGNKWHDSEY